MQNLFLVMLGGRHARANTEVHDVVLAIGDRLEDVYPQLKQAWFGESKGLHIDSWMQINGVETVGKKYQIHIKKHKPITETLKLFLINLGGYDAQEFGELHRYILVVAADAIEAKQRGKTYFAEHWTKQHTDRVLEVDDCFAIDCIDGHYIHLIEGAYPDNTGENCYITIG
jgi:thiamine pyrophosphate-dependent acetolactate synthase large subunit-like protein